MQSITGGGETHATSRSISHQCLTCTSIGRRIRELAASSLRAPRSVQSVQVVQMGGLFERTSRSPPGSVAMTSPRDRLPYN
ncbi:MAG: hypothetical protein ACKOTD_01735 [Phycisphaerales bacterium]